jgi:hypothetical protein
LAAGVEEAWRGPERERERERESAEMKRDSRFPNGSSASATNGIKIFRIKLNTWWIVRHILDPIFFLFISAFQFSFLMQPTWKAPQWKNAERMSQKLYRKYICVGFYLLIPEPLLYLLFWFPLQFLMSVLRNILDAPEKWELFFIAEIIYLQGI